MPRQPSLFELSKTQTVHAKMQTCICSESMFARLSNEDLWNVPHKQAEQASFKLRTHSINKEHKQRSFTRCIDRHTHTYTCTSTPFTTHTLLKGICHLLRARLVCTHSAPVRLAPNAIKCFDSCPAHWVYILSTTCARFTSRHAMRDQLSWVKCS